MQIKTTAKHNLTLVRRANIKKNLQIVIAGEGMEKKGSPTPLLVGMQVCAATVKNSMKTELPYYSAILLLGIYPEKTLIHKDTCTRYIHSSTFTVAKTWK